MRPFILLLVISFSLTGAAVPQEVAQGQDKKAAVAPAPLDTSDAALRASLSDLYKRQLVSLVVMERLDELEALIDDEAKAAEEKKKNEDVRKVLAATIRPAIDQALKIIVAREQNRIPEPVLKMHPIGRLSHRGLELGFFASRENFDAGKPDYVLSTKLTAENGTGTVTDITVTHYKP